MDDRAADLQHAYVELLKSSLLARANGPMRVLYPVPPTEGGLPRRLLQRRLLRRGGTVLAHEVVLDPEGDPEGRRDIYELPLGIKTMVGQRRLESVESMVADIVRDSVPGDMIETGVWRGGTTIFLRGLLRAHGVTDRTVYVADSFQGLPPPDVDRYPADAGLDFHLVRELAVSVEEVQASFARYGLLDDQVRFVPGWFRDTLPGLAGHPWSLLRLDGDLYESTMDALTNLYPSLSVGGWIVIDDFSIAACAKAVEDFRADNGITTPMQVIDWTGRAWRREA